eukprot:CAMPEP_0197645014 /NCGR_PEP_ID=MMETSP1338-20131121/17806_1 /TAXON_ID=43686 ORGANISM="Pelagodinium beii, Strain RCC1491" /NCGR_SAMPLE_ID=MMETSP1338 /ASSEMBLY_ACC=CAM_ASM_000754 /LENGTH=397 /DNA_ID=CAMNT_0043218505 /DNA_START=60 /DNA_END=1250 /DNA_ORIENTATION=+
MDVERARSRSPRTSTVDEIVRLVYAREQARLDKDWELADSIRQQLQDAGVSLFDKNSQWRTADGRSGRIPSFTELEESGNLAAHEAESPEEGVQAQIKELVQQREHARANKDFAESDRIREQLKAMGVELLDKEKLWKCSSHGLQGIIMGYSKHSGPTDMEVRTLIIEREKARQASNYELSDIIREELKAAGVTLSDKTKTWSSSDGRSGTVPSWAEIMGDVQPHPPVMMPAPAAHARNVRMPAVAARVPSAPSVEEQLMEAARAAAANPVTAARALQLLKQAAAEVAPHRSGIRAAPPARGAAPPARGAAPPARGTVMARREKTELQEALGAIQDMQMSSRAASDDEIDWLVTVREKLRQSKDYNGADELRNALRQDLGIDLVEKEKRWTCTDGRE